MQGLRSQLETERADREQIEAELAKLTASQGELAQLKNQNNEVAPELHREERSIESEKVRWQQQLSDGRAELADAKATILKQGDKIRELERGYSFKPSPVESALRREIGELQSQLETAHEENRKSLSVGKEFPDAADLLNQLKARRKKSKTDLADVEEILELLGGSDG